MTITRLLRISRPRFWLYECGTYAIGIAAAGGGYAIWLNPLVLVFWLFFLYPANIFIYGINDIHDYETDRLNPKKIAYETLVMPAEHRHLYRHVLLVSLPFLLLAIVFLPILPLLALLLFWFFAGFYSAPPIRAKAIPIADSFFSAAHYVVTGVFGYLLASHILSETVAWDSLVTLAVAGLLWAIAMHAYSAVPDMAADETANLRTIATTLRKTPTIILCAALYAGAAVLAWPFLGILAIVLGAVYVAFMLYSIGLPNNELFATYAYFPYLNALSGMSLFFYAWFF